MTTPPNDPWGLGPSGRTFDDVVRESQAAEERSNQPLSQAPNPNATREAVAALQRFLLSGGRQVTRRMAQGAEMLGDTADDLSSGVQQFTRPGREARQPAVNQHFLRPTGEALRAAEAGLTQGMDRLPYAGMEGATDFAGSMVGDLLPAAGLMRGFGVAGTTARAGLRPLLAESAKATAATSPLTLADAQEEHMSPMQTLASLALDAGLGVVGDGIGSRLMGPSGGVNAPLGGLTTRDVGPGGAGRPVRTGSDPFTRNGINFVENTYTTPNGDVSVRYFMRPDGRVHIDHVGRAGVPPDSPQNTIGAGDMRQILNDVREQTGATGWTADRISGANPGRRMEGSFVELTPEQQARRDIPRLEGLEGNTPPSRAMQEAESIAESVLGPRIPREGDRFAIVTPENPRGTPTTPEQNAARRAEFERELRERGYEATPVRGRYLDSDTGNLLDEAGYYIPGMGEREARLLGARWGQNSVVTQSGGHNLLDGSTSPSRGIGPADDIPYTELPDGSRFALDIDWATSQPGRSATLPVPKGANPEVMRIADSYVRGAGIQGRKLPRVTQVDPERAALMARTYEQLRNMPDSPEVRRAYEQLGRETDAQFKAIEDAGYKIEFVDDDPYKSSKEMMADLRDNRRLRVYRTGEGQGHPILTNEQNDRFRAVHDFFGHSRGGNQFGARGEEGAFRDHSSMFSPEAARAMATETRGQNSWVNYGPNRHLPAPERPFAEQKAALWPEGLMGDYGDMKMLDPDAPNARPFREWSPDELEEYGQRYGVPGMGRASEPHMVKLSDGREVNIPGGLDGEWTYRDINEIKAQGIDPKMLPPGMHVAMQAKMGRTMSPGGFSDEAHNFRGLALGITSPNNPLTPNEFAVSRIMPRNMDDIRELAKMAPPPGASNAEGLAASKRIAEHFGLQKGKAGGLGVRGSARYDHLANMARLFEKRPDFFQRAPDEPWGDFVERISTQVPGLGDKTGSFAAVWQDPANAGVSAIDRHMGQIFWDSLTETPKERRALERALVKQWNESGVAGRKKVRNFEQLRQQDSDDFFNEAIAAQLNAGKKKVKFRLANGEINPRVPEHLRNVDWIEEPQFVNIMGDNYKRALAENARVAEEQGLGLFNSQWNLWDAKRGNIEPHAVMYPGLNRLPRMPHDQAKHSLAAHTEAGYLSPDSPKYPRKIQPVQDWRDMMFWGLLGGVGVGGAAATQEQEAPRGLLF